MANRDNIPTGSHRRRSKGHDRCHDGRNNKEAELWDRKVDTQGGHGIRQRKVISNTIFITDRLRKAQTCMDYFANTYHVGIITGSCDDLMVIGNQTSCLLFSAIQTNASQKPRSGNFTVTWCIRCQSNLPRRQNVADPSKSTLLFFQIFTNIHSTMVRIALISFPLLSFHFETQKKCYLCMYFLIKISLPVVPVSFHLTLSTVPFLRCLCHYGICHGLRTLCDAFQSVRFYQFYYDICIPLVTISCFLICFSTYDHGAIDLLFA